MIPKFRAWHHELGRMMALKSMWFQDDLIEELELNDTVSYFLNLYDAVKPFNDIHDLKNIIDQILDVEGML